ncbi:cardiolipin synthase [Paracoccus zhejiangensis]|uniref:Cardiolipin synthase n=1 Tax=Paracoccus zhejiangensis TaxID=1077935 RepID=A0A2H5EU73_9RHOB|nr:cardiolipin synthase [Paracoccus zhejiangensis]AUH62843.1 cardiolipin synthase [Paracoccus zhejiangensis]
MWPTAFLFLHNVAALLVVARVLIRPRMEPSVRLAWIMVVEAIPIVGIGAYLLFGEVRMRQAEVQKMADVRDRLTGLRKPSPNVITHPPNELEPVFAVNRAVGGLQAVDGNRLHLLSEGDDAIDAMVDAIDGAQDHVHIVFYIWLADDSGTRMVEAIERAARRGIDCRVIVDALGSRLFVRSALWTRMQAAGAECVTAFPWGMPLISLLFQRLDLRNHRKIMVVDNAVAFTGSRNCADMAFALKPKYAPWVDILVSAEGPVVRQLQGVFLADWMSYTGRDLGEMLAMVDAVEEPGDTAQVVATGPDRRAGSISDSLATMILNARSEIVLTTPYYVPDMALDAAIRSAARRGVEVTMILPARNDSLIVGATSEGFYYSLLAAGVRIYLFQPGLLHSKITTVDNRYAMIGSANLDRRSFELNYEVNMAIYDSGVTDELNQRQASYVARSVELSLEDVKNWSLLRRIRNNLLALASPLL